MHHRFKRRTSRSTSKHLKLTISLKINEHCFVLFQVLTYVAEITQPHLRGMLSSTSTMSVILGVLIQFLLGSFLHWRTVALVNCIIPVTSFVLLFFVPESPHWLIMKNRLLDARKSIAWLRGWTTLDEIEPEFKELCRHLQKNSKEGIDNPAFDGNEVYSSTNNNTKDAVGFVRSKLESLKLLAKKNFVFPYLLVSFSFFLGHFSGMTTLQTYAVQIFATLKTPIDKYYATIILGVAELAGCIGCVSLIHYTGKRPLTFLSMITCSLCFFIVATYAYISDIHYLETSRVNKTTNNVTTVDLMYQEDAEVNLNWIPTTFLIASAFLSHIGIRILPWILTGEVYTNETRAAASGLSSGISYIFGFLANKVFLKMISTITLPGTFWFYSCVGLMGTLVLYFALPETEGKSLHEITEHFSGKKKLDNKVHRKRKVFGGEANHGYANTENGFRNNTPSDAESHL